LAILESRQKYPLNFFAQYWNVHSKTITMMNLTQEKNELSFEVLSDRGNLLAKQFGLVFTLPKALRPIYSNFGIDIPAHNGDATFELPLPATYVVAADGTVVYSFAHGDYTQRLNPGEIIKQLNLLNLTVTP
jgi:peroxiredoxin